MLDSGSKSRERSPVQGVLQSAISITKQRNQPYDPQLEQEEREIIPQGVLQSAKTITKLRNQHYAPQWEQVERKVIHPRSPTDCKMAMKLRNHPYAPQWVQEEREITRPRSPTVSKNDHETEKSALCSTVGASGEKDHPPKESYRL
jgi:hypothetical protein